MGIIPRLILMMRNRRLADISMAEEKEQLAKQAALEKKREQDRLLAVMNGNSSDNSLNWNLGSLLRD
jgi:hypothetical protein